MYFNIKHVEKVILVYLANGIVVVLHITLYVICEFYVANLYEIYCQNSFSKVTSY